MAEDRIDASAIPDDDVTWTMLATLYLRAQENRRARPVLGDPYAAEALARIDYRFPPMRRRLLTGGAQFIVTLRGRRFDDWARACLARRPDATVLHLGCGLDSRMLRLDPEHRLRWYDLDIPPVMALRRRLYAERGGYRMIDASVSDRGWLESIPADRPVLVVAEGLLPYLTPEAVGDLLRRITDHFPAGDLIFDGVPPWMVRIARPVSWTPATHPVTAAAPRLTLAERVPISAGYDRIPVRGYRAMYRFVHAVRPLREFLVGYRYTF
ncbi:class I SAM-dependent methyltransferase [Catenuloplanes atrovinosus]|uniref:O-methyltransferase involved in polyketide biosynthesis n=1 Tax=Catenuloplanes atrovinosus TaxID=137266 RepID=A0AAE3YMW9_9ACTN|nr:class I SAM-dependent methyltransferase [Catenuloplanes atrovinosus]MDR7275281.1 O-methyltransferase involved in polyketide biosynthesis [Catenuloplanes atrovinosus]